MEERAPIPPVYPIEAIIESQLATKVLRFYVTRLHLAAQSLEIQAETRFTSIILFIRYLSFYFHFRSNNNNHHNNSGNHSAAINDEDTLNPLECEYLKMVATVCLFLGCKVEEEPRRIRDVINVSYLVHLTYSNDYDWNNTNLLEIGTPPELNDKYWIMKERVVEVEQEVLRMLQFDVHVSHPYRVLVSIIGSSPPLGLLKKNEEEACNYELTEKYWTLLNSVPLCDLALLKRSPIEIAAIVLWMTNKEIMNSNQCCWMESLNLTEEKMKSMTQRLHDALKT